MPTSPYFPTYYQGHSGEQNLIQDLVDEQIKLFGSDVYYIPRIALKDNTLDEIRYSKYQEQFQIERKGQLIQLGIKMNSKVLQLLMMFQRVETGIFHKIL